MRQRIVSFLTLLCMLLLAGCSLIPDTGSAANSTPAATNPPAATNTPTPSSQTLAYIGSDGNVWVMPWPNGTPKQLTTDAHGTDAYGRSIYTNLSWSPDGLLLAVAKGAIGNSNGSMLIFKPDGTEVANVPLPAMFYHEIPFAWSPDSTMLAFRGGVSEGPAPSSNGLRKLLLFDAHTGKTVKTLTYEVGGFGGCGGGGPVSPLAQELWFAEHVGFQAPEDAFAWSADGHTLLFTRVALQSCGKGESILLDINTGKTDAPYPSLGSYQPGGNLILGYWHDGTLGLTDLSAKHVQALVKPEAFNPSYLIGLGRAAWASGGQTIYYEHNDSIWQINVDGSNPHQVVAGTALDNQQNATLQLVPAPSPDGKLLLYLQVKGSNRAVEDGDPTPQPTPTIPLTTQWYVAQADGSNPVALPQGVQEAIWQPVP